LAKNKLAKKHFGDVLDKIDQEDISHEGKEMLWTSGVVTGVSEVLSFNQQCVSDCQGYVSSLSY
jgi:hypothetical protein